MNMNAHDSSHLNDEALSVLLDGDGETDVPAGAATHLAGCASCAARQAGLAAARTALRVAPVETVDDLTRRRLISAAMAATAEPAPVVTRRPWYLRPVMAGGVAAALLLVFATVAFLGGDKDSNDTVASSAAGSGEIAAAFLGDLGDISDDAAVRAAFGGAGLGGSGLLESGTDTDAAANERTVAAPEATATAGGVPAGDAAGSSAYQQDLPDDSQTNFAPPQAPEPRLARDEAAKAAVLDRTVTDQCTTALARGPARSARLVAVGIGTYRNTAAVVAAYETAAGTEVFVTARDGCDLLTRYRL